MVHTEKPFLPLLIVFSHHRYLGLQFFFEVGAFLCFVTVYMILRRQEMEARNAPETKTDPEKKKLAESTTKGPESKV